VTDQAHSLEGRVALVTGSSSGIGKGIALHLASLGASVFVTGRDEKRGKATVREITEAGSRAAFANLDLIEADNCQALVDKVLGEFGCLDVLVNNAAITTRGDARSTSVDEWDAILAINLRAPFFLIQAAIAPMEQQGGGSIINIGSINAYIGEPKLTAYSASKGGLMTLTKNVAAQLNQVKIRVNQLNVGWTFTEGEDKVKKEEEGKGDDWLEEAEATRPFGRLLLPKDIAYAVGYFASDASACITGSVLDLEQFPVGAPPAW
jgi:NAD(P)-dependent dehydrogenase (short-subunit alcohol dehydrogenase family)